MLYHHQHPTPQLGLYLMTKRSQDQTPTTELPAIRTQSLTSTRRTEIKIQSVKLTVAVMKISILEY
jgi:hypothetical protein